FREVPRLGDRVLGEARAALEIALIGEPLEELVDGERQPKREAGEQVPDLPDLALVAGGDKQLHRGVSHTGFPRSRASSAVVEAPGTSGTRTTRPPHAST